MNIEFNITNIVIVVFGGKDKKYFTYKYFRPFFN